MFFFSPIFAEPQFVASFDAGEQVLFFLRELAVEYSNCGKKIYSRVARVCKVSFTLFVIICLSISL